MSRRGVSQQHRWPTWGWGLLALFAALSFSACIDDVVIPECFLKGTCPEAGAGGDAEPPGSGAGGGLVDVAGQGMGGMGAEAAAAGQGGEAGREAPGPNTCSTCAVLPQHLTAACAGKPYRATLSVSGGLEPYSWRLAPQPKGWSIANSPGDTEAAILRASAAPAEATELTVVVTDARGLHLSLTFTLDARSNCWFAYSGVASDVPELWLVDPLAEDPQRTPLAHQRGVYDFQFSPDGAFLAYRYGQDAEHPQGRHLSLVDLASLKEHDVGFAEDQVLSYAWAPSSDAIAAAFEKDGDRYLGAAVPPAPGSDDSPTSLTSTAASIDSDLYWVGSEYLAFHAASGQGALRTAYYAQFSSKGFAAPKEVFSSFGSGVAVQSADSGFFLIEPVQTFFSDLTGGVWVGVDHVGAELVAPSGRYTGRLAGNGLPQLLPAGTGDVGPIVEAEDGAESCTKLLAWSAGEERLACVADVSNGDGTNHGEVRIFDLHSDPDRLVQTTIQGFCREASNDAGTDTCLVKREGYSYASLQATGSGRAFSASGRYFAFARALPDFVYVYFADLNASPVSVAEPTIYRVDGTSTNPIAFAFSPDERFLLVRRGPRLSVIELQTGATGTLSQKLVDAELCSEDFLASPKTYCGNSDQVAAPRWAMDSLRAAFRTTDGLTIADLSPFPTKDVKVLPAPACGARCAGKFAFQP